MSQHEILFMVFSYLVGAFPTGFILYYLAEKKDIREVGSGNMGAANMMRVRGKTLGIVTLILDVSKGALPILYGMHHFISPFIVIGGGAAAVLGHIFPVFLKFKGGKGVATFVGVFLVFSFPASALFLAAFLAAVLLTKYVSLGSVTGTVSVFFFILFTRIAEVSMVVLGLVILIAVKHGSNFRRIAAGTENKLKLKKNG